MQCTLNQCYDFEPLTISNSVFILSFKEANILITLTVAKICSYWSLDTLMTDPQTVVLASQLCGLQERDNQVSDAHHFSPFLREK